MKIFRFMKPGHLFTAFLSALIILSSCDKISDTNPEGESKGNLQKSVSGDCLPVVKNGIYLVDSGLNNNNYVDVQVDVAIGGSFIIKTDSVNGYSFKKSGTVGTGLNTIRLYATGKPVATGVNTFTVTYGLTSCSFSVTVYNAAAGSARYTLGGSPGDCSVSSINGNYLVGQSMTASNKAEMTVNVSSTGSYSILGPVLNGVSFNASGVFTNPGIQNIFLSASGTPVATGTFVHPVTNTTTTCNLPISYTSTITNASFALSGSPNNCTGAQTNGTYTVGTALNAQNYAVIYVNVTSPGVYAIATTTVNGISFAASGTFNLTGQQLVNLTGTGTPTASGTFNFPVSGNGNSCGISVTCN